MRLHEFRPLSPDGRRHPARVRESPTGLLDAPERVRTACENVPWELVEVTVRYPYGRSHHKWVSRRVMRQEIE
jgi:hypothetical protein